MRRLRAIDSHTGGEPTRVVLEGGPVLTGTLAEKFPNQWLAWDRENMKVSNMPEANALVKRDYRDGWKVEGLG